METVCTYCSSSKDPSSGLVPAYKRYISTRIIHVQEIAEREKKHFCILSGKFGLVDWNQPLPWYDHLLLKEEVSQRVETVVNQLIEKEITSVEYYTISVEVDKKILPYLELISASCARQSVELTVKHLNNLDNQSLIRNWKYIMEKAADAGELLVRNRSEGENEFTKLLKQYPDDGMVYFQRAKAYEEVNEYTSARSDYQTSEQLFPLERWKREAQLAIDKLDSDLSSGGTIKEASRRLQNLLNVDHNIKQTVIAIIEKTHGDPLGTAVRIRTIAESLAHRLLIDSSTYSSHKFDLDIQSLRNKSIIPEIVANHFHTIRIIGNQAAHPRHDLKVINASDIYPCVTALIAILEWMNQWEGKKS